MTKGFTVGFLIGFTLLGMGGVGASKLKQREKDNDQALYAVEAKDATPVQLNVVTDRQRARSKLYSGFRRSEDGTLIELIAPYKDKTIVYGISIDVNIPRLSAEAESPATYFDRLGRESDLVVRGKVTSKLSQITEDAKFVFTDYDVLIEEVLKKTGPARVSVGSKISVSCPGGKVLIGTVVVKIGGNGIAALPVNDHEVLLFLRALEENEAYRLVRYDGGFEIDGATMRGLSGQFPAGYLSNSDSLLETVRAVTSKQNN